MLNRTQEEIIERWKGCDLSRPLVSIRCMAFNHELYIENALDGFLMQETDFPFEVIVHDDASTDRTADIIRQYEKKFPLIIRPIYEEENLYSKDKIKMRNIINPFLRGKYIALCEGDDYWCDKRKLQMQVDALETNPDCSVSFCGVQFIEKDGTKLEQTAPAKGAIEKNIVNLEDYAREEYGNGQWTFHTSSFFYRALYNEAFYQARDNQLKYFPYGDMPLVLFLLSQGNGYFIPEIMSCYRTLSGGYNSYIRKNPKVAIAHSKMLVKAVRLFDKQTNRKYHKYIIKKISREKIFQGEKKNGKWGYLCALLNINCIKHLGLKMVCYEWATKATPQLYYIYKKIKK